MRPQHSIIEFVRHLTVIVLIVAAAIVATPLHSDRVTAQSTITESVVVLDPEKAAMLSGNFQAVNRGYGDQIDPHVDGDLASYTDDAFGSMSIHYFDFATNTDQIIPGNGTDFGSGVSGETITFTEASPLGSLVVLFNTTTQSRTVVPGVQNSHSKVGGNLVVFENRSFFSQPNLSEISVYDVKSGVVSRLTNDFEMDKNPAVSPSGDVVLWEKCNTSGLECDIYSAIQTAPGVFTTSVLADKVGEDVRPQTDGQIAVYLSNRDGEFDVYFQPVAGGVETQLSIPGEQRSAKIAGNLITFESAMKTEKGTDFDLFVYDIAAARLYRVTDTVFSETLNDVTMRNGFARIVYSHPGSEDFDVSAFTFTPPTSTSPEDQIDDLIDLIKSFNLPEGIETSLITKLMDALAAIHASDVPTACACLKAFIYECEAQSGNKLTEEQASQLISAANQIKTELGCQ